MNEERIYQRLERLERDYVRLETRMEEATRRISRLERLPEDITEIKQSLAEIKADLEGHGAGWDRWSSLIWGLIMLVMGYLLNTLPRLLFGLKGS